MEAKELRIGSWVLFGEAKMEIDANDFKDCDANGLMHQLYKPIPLTEEWLIKFGFEADGNTWDAPNDRWKITVEREDFETFELMISENFVSSFEEVHQLQNLYFALTGEELTIKE